MAAEDLSNHINLEKLSIKLSDCKINLKINKQVFCELISKNKNFEIEFNKIKRENSLYGKKISEIFGKKSEIEKKSFILQYYLDKRNSWEKERFDSINEEIFFLTNNTKDKDIIISKLRGELDKVLAGDIDFHNEIFIL